MRFGIQKLMMIIKRIVIGLLCVFLTGFQQQSNAQEAKEETKKMTNKVEEKTWKPEDTEIWDPEPQELSFNKNNVPSDAIVLFDGSNLDQWEHAYKAKKVAGWTLNGDGTMTVKPGSGDIKTKVKFGSIQLHLEWKSPTIVESEGQGRGNSGIFFQDKYEVQILDSYKNRTYANGQATAVYKQYVPLVNAMKSPQEWQTYDIIFHAPEFDASGNKTKSGTFTVIHNGVLVQDHIEILGTTEYIGPPKNPTHGDDVIKLQDHGNTVSYRNIWVRKL